MNLTKKNVIITGVSSGLGFYMAKWAAEAGYKVYGTVRKIESVILPHDSVVLIEMDVASRDSIQQACELLKHTHHLTNLHALVNNAGIAVAGPLAYLDEEKFQEQMQINCVGVFMCIKKFFPFMLDSDGARIINIGSISGIFGSPFLGAYCASKFALEGMTDAFRREAALKNIQVALLQPASIRTPIWAKSKGVGQQFLHTPFADFILAADDIIEATEQSAMDVEVLKKPFLHALSAERIKTRYLIHKKPFLAKLLLTFVPDVWLDKMAIKQISSKHNKLRPV